MSVVRRLALIPRLAVVAIVGLVAIAWPHCVRGAATIVVDTAVDEDVANAHCSLREAIIAANTNASYHGCAATGAGVNDQITFDIGSGTPAINISTTPLPAITEWVTIDGGSGRVELHGPGGPAVSGQHGLSVSLDGFGTTIRNLVVNNFADDGIFINADEVSVLGCRIGTDATGMTAVPNQGFGVQVGGGNGVRIGGATSGGTCTGDCNLVSGAISEKANVLLDLNVTGALVRGNFIGTDVTGTAKIANSAAGIIDKGGSDRIGGANGTTPGGSCSGDCNLISGNNTFGGIVVDQAATGAIIQGNFIGTDVTGTQSIGNANPGGIASYATGVQIGGTTPLARNVVSGNADSGIQISGSTSTTVQGNYIGTNSAGDAAVPGSGVGVLVFQTGGATIGGTAAGAGNLISGSSDSLGVGVWIDQSKNTQIMGNLIGTAADGTTPLPNSSGVYISNQSSLNFVGGEGAGAGNTIAFNDLDGVRVDGESPPVGANRISGNSIYSNGDAGIALVDDANDDLAPPTIEGLDPLHGTACAPCTVEIFSDSDAQGRVFEGSVVTNDGNWTFNGPVSGPHVTATNTDMSNDTSEFSAPVSLTTPTPAPSPTSSPSPTIATLTATPTRTPTRTSTGTSTSTATDTRTGTATAASTPRDTPTATGSRTAAASPTPPGTATTTATATPSNTATVTSTWTPSATAPSARTVTPTLSATVTTTASRTAPATLSPTDAPTPVSSATLTVTVTPTLSANPTPTGTSAHPCTGDCNNNHVVSINELIIGVDIALGGLPGSACPSFKNAQGLVDIAQLIHGVNNALNGCSS